MKRLSEGLGLQRDDQPTSVQWQLKGDECHSSLQKLEMDLSCSLGGLRRTSGKDTFTRKVVQHWNRLFMGQPESIIVEVYKAF